MSNVEPETIPVDIPPAPKDNGKSKSKKPRKQKPGNTEVGHIFSGRIEALKILGHDDKTCVIEFNFKGKKNNLVHFSVSATDVARFHAISSLLNTALARDLKMKVVALPAETGPRAVTELSVLV
jgi:hypothetical protein